MSEPEDAVEVRIGEEELDHVLDELKPNADRATAEAYLATGSYWWNSGMFVWRAATLLEQLRLLLPDTHSQVLELARRPEQLAEIYPSLVKISVDYAVMEPVSLGHGSAHVVAVRLPITWHDVGEIGRAHV